MQRFGDQLVFSATDLTRHLACPHTTTLDLAVTEGRLDRPVVADDVLELVFRLGITHEQAYLQRLRDEGRSIVEIATVFDEPGRRAAERATLDALRAGVDVVYQASFFDGSWGGQADFLLRVERPSRLGGWSYEVADTKLARRLKVPALLQMAVYADRLTRLQGVEPAHLYVVTGDGVSRPWRLVDVAAYARRARARLERAVADRRPTTPVPVAHCGGCRWLSRCAREWRRADDLSLVAFLRADHRQALIEAGITTLAALAGARPADLPRAIGAPSRERLVGQAALQVQERRTGDPSYALLPPAAGMGLLRLPVPDPGDLYLDFEGDPYAEGGEGREYLAGLGDRQGGYRARWAHDPSQERALTCELLDAVTGAWKAHPGMHVYHYAAYETAALKRLTARHGVREAELDELLRAGRFVDLYTAVRQGVRVSKESYSIKQLEAFYWGAVCNHGGDVADALASVAAYERWLAERDDTVLGQIEAYNHDDVRSTRDLHAWLETLRTELEARHGPQPRPEPPDVGPARPLSAEEADELDLASRLRAAGHDLVAGLVQWHRREARPAWWEVFRLGELDDDQLVDDSVAIGQLSPPAHLGAKNRSRLYGYRFPAQDTQVRAGEAAFDVDTHARIGEVVEVDPVAGRLVVKTSRSPATPRGVGPPGPVNDQVLRTSIHESAEAILRGHTSVLTALLDRCPPPGLRDRPGEAPVDTVVRVGTNLDGDVLAVQGPPGSGKTTVAARLIRALLDQGRTVGVTANSHAVIGNLLNAVDRPGLQKCQPDQHCGHPQVSQTDDNARVVDALATGAARLVGGTAWLWARGDMTGSVDVLVIDEAGQTSLANTVAVARATRSLVLVGDPQQLSQPTRALHPPDSGVSALGHLLEGRATLPPDRGVFLDTSWRMHPAITAFVSDLAYDDRLRSAPGREHQTILPPGPLAGSGLHLLPVHHRGMSAASPPEADAVAALWHELIGRTHQDHDLRQHRVTPDDILVIAPYNNQVALIRQRLPPTARVGTVDRFQGQEAAIVLYSMTSSTSEDAPRGIDFLYDPHRLNVAISRARTAAAIVLNPELLDAPAHDTAQLHKVNNLCRYAEVALWG